MNQRTTPYLIKPTADFIEVEGLLQTTTLYLVSRSGPCVFGVKDDTDKVYKVVLGNPHFCSCNVNSSNYCVHRLFCLIKVLRIQSSNPLCYQSSLTDYEINQAVNGTTENSSRFRRILSRSNTKSTSNDNIEPKLQTVNRQPLDEDQPETCPICQDDMTKDQALTWCRSGCGNNLHAKCMLKFCQFKQTNRQDPSCPFCREVWDMEILKLDCRGKSSLKKSCSPIYCNGCSNLLRNTFYRCIDCSQIEANLKENKKPFDFCEQCFLFKTNKIHRQHHFLTSNASIESIDEVSWITHSHPHKEQQTNIISPPLRLLELQNRELSTNDYELLLDLDSRYSETTQDLLSTLINILPNYKINKKQNINDIKQETRKCWCDIITNNNHIINSTCGNNTLLLKVLPCNHVAHDNCIKSDLKSILKSYENSETNHNIINCTPESQLYDYKCKHLLCEKQVFLCLNRKRKSKSKQKSENINDNNNKNHAKVDSYDSLIRNENIILSVGVTGIGFNQERIYNNNNNNNNNNSHSNSHTVRNKIIGLHGRNKSHQNEYNNNDSINNLSLSVSNTIIHNTPTQLPPLNNQSNKIINHPPTVPKRPVKFGRLLPLEKMTGILSTRLRTGSEPNISILNKSNNNIDSNPHSELSMILSSSRHLRPDIDFLVVSNNDNTSLQLGIEPIHNNNNNNNNNNKSKQINHHKRGIIMKGTINHRNLLMKFDNNNSNNLINHHIDHNHSSSSIDMNSHDIHSLITVNHYDST
eukprot:gene12348-16561_t